MEIHAINQAENMKSKAFTDSYHQLALYPRQGYSGSGDHAYALTHSQIYPTARFQEVEQNQEPGETHMEKIKKLHIDPGFSLRL